MVSAVIVEEENALFVCVCTGENAGLSCDMVFRVPASDLKNDHPDSQSNVEI